MFMAISTTTACMVQNYDLEGALTTLRKGGLILYPTDTIWSIGCDATNAFAIETGVKPKKGSFTSRYRGPGRFSAYA